MNVFARTPLRSLLSMASCISCMLFGAAITLADSVPTYTVDQGTFECGTSANGAMVCSFTLAGPDLTLSGFDQTRDFPQGAGYPPPYSPFLISEVRFVPGDGTVGGPGFLSSGTVDGTSYGQLLLTGEAFLTAESSIFPNTRQYAYSVPASIVGTLGTCYSTGGDPSLGASFCGGDGPFALNIDLAGNLTLTYAEEQDYGEPAGPGQLIGVAFTATPEPASWSLASIPPFIIGAIVVLKRKSRALVSQVDTNGR